MKGYKKPSDFIEIKVPKDHPASKQGEVTSNFDDSYSWTEIEIILNYLRGREEWARRVFDVARKDMCMNPGDIDAQRFYYQSRGALNEIRDIVRYVEDLV